MTTMFKFSTQKSDFVAFYSYIFINENVAIRWWVFPMIFLAYKSFLRMISIYKMGYYYFFWAIFDTYTWCHASILFGDTLTLISFKISTTFFSNFWSRMLSGISVISMLLRCPYCSSELCSFSRVKTLFSRTCTLFWDAYFLLECFR